MCKFKHAFGWSMLSSEAIFQLHCCPRIRPLFHASLRPCKKHSAFPRRCEGCSPCVVTRIAQAVGTVQTVSAGKGICRSSEAKSSLFRRRFHEDKDKSSLSEVLTWHLCRWHLLRAVFSSLVVWRHQSLQKPLETFSYWHLATTQILFFTCRSPAWLFILYMLNFIIGWAVGFHVSQSLWFDIFSFHVLFCQNLHTSAHTESCPQNLKISLFLSDW